MSADLLANVRAAFSAAQAASTPQARQFAVGGLHIRLVFSGDALVPGLFSAFAHLAEPAEGRPDLTICIWDSETTGAPTPPLPAFEGNQAWLMNGDTTGAYAATPGEQFYLLDFASNEAFFWSASPRLPQPECGSPLIPILHWWLHTHGWLFLHAAAVGTPELGGALLVGQGGRGKSSTALSCLDSSLQFLSDDYCLAQVDGRLHSLYCSAKVGNASLHHLQFLEPARSPLQDPAWEKHMFFLDTAFKGRLTPQLTARCVMLTSVTRQPDTWAEPIRAPLALKALAPSTLYQLRFSRHTDQLLGGMRGLVDSLPCFTLHLGTVRQQIPQVIERTLRQCA